MKAENDLLKFNTARELHNHVQQIRENYHEDMISSKMKIRQRALALYFIDRVCSVLGHCSVSKVALHVITSTPPLTVNHAVNLNVLLKTRTQK